MKRLLLYIIALMLLPQVAFAAVLVGKTEGAFSVSPSGAATYTIPIKVQNGLSEFSPSISLTYNSQSGNGIAGMGFSISGLSAISIVPRSVYFDGQAECIYPGEDNVFTLDGQRLLLTSGNDGQIDATYRTENEKYSLISITDTLHGTPATFQVKTTDGTTYKYGNTSGRLTLSNGEAYQWALDYAEDALGNYIQYAYSQEGVLYPTSITYGRNTHGTAGVDCTILFNYENRTDSVPTYLFGEQRYLKKRLKSIVCKYDGNIYRTYTLNYTVDTFSHLTSVTEAGTGTSTVPSTTFEWEVPAEFQLSGNSCTLETAFNENLNKENFFSGDLDGDGISEIISVESRNDTVGTSYWPYIYFDCRKWNPNDQEFSLCYSWRTQSGITIDYNLFRILKSGGVVMHVIHGERNSLVFPYCRIEDDCKSMVFNFLREDVKCPVLLKGRSEAMPLYTILDVDKNGFDEIFVIEREKQDGTYYPAYLVSCDLNSETPDTTEFRLVLDGVPDKIIPADFNSDGMVDLFVSTFTGYYIYWNRFGSFSDSDRYHSTEFGKCDIIEVGDFNGDGLPDLIIKEWDNTHTLITEPYSTHWYIALNTGNEDNGYFLLHSINSLSGVGAKNHDDRLTKLYCLVQDIDGDGKSDVFVGAPYHTDGEGSCIRILRSEGNTLTPIYGYNITNSDAFPKKAHIIQGNFTGTAGGEIIYRGKGFDHNAIGWYQLKNPTVKASSQKMISVTDGLGARDSISYGLLTDEDVYSISNNHTFPLIPMAGGFPVVKTRTESIPTESRTTNYSYANGIVHLQGKGFLGFEDMRQTSSTGIVIESHCVLDSTFYVLLPHTVIQRNTDGDIIFQKNSRTILQKVEPYDDCCFIINSTNNSTENPFDGFSKNEYYWDFENGFPLYQSEDDGFFDIETKTTYWESILNNVWIKGLPEEIEITKTGLGITGDDVYEKITYERASATGLVLKETRRRNGQLVSTDGYTYNEYGQVVLHYNVPYNSTDTLVTTFEYYPNGKLKKEYDPKGLYRQYTYNSTYGTLSSIRDFDGVVTHYAYDGMLRETNRHTQISAVNTTRALSSYGGSAYSVKEKKTGETPITTYYDAWERKVAESAPLANNIAMYTDFHYLPNGKIGFVSFPHKSSQPTQEGTTYSYDDLFRKTSVVDTNGKTSTWGYDYTCWVESCKDGITTVTTYYVKDVIAGVYDDAGWVEYEYNADGNVCLISSDAGEASYTYDTYGRLTQTTDMNGVTKRYTYDRNGYPDSTIIAGSYVKTTYDKFGILRSKSWSDPNESVNTVNYSYDSKFRLTREAGAGYLNTYSYDSYGRMTQKLKRVTDNNHTVDMNVSIQYDSYNHVSCTTSSFNNVQTTVTERFYYNNGYKTKDVLNDSTVWSLTSQDRWGNITGTTDSLGTTTYSYDDYGNMLSMNRSGNTSLSESYTYNVQTGNMSSKNNVPLTYDSMNQLTGWGSQTYNYDDLGNITSQPLVGQFSYDGFKVDGMTTENSYVIDDSLRISYYKAIERPKSIVNEHYKAEFYYDGNGDRYMMKVYKKVAGQYSHYLTRYYLDANTEITVNELSVRRCMYYAGGDAYTAPAVMDIHEFAGPCIYQITRDNLGSVLLYENANGTRYQYSYSPWGVRTHQVGGNTVFYQPGDDSPFGPFYRTYTGHEDLWMFGLINANARLYSPYLGRFVSPDPLLNSEGGPLDYNPYIYARNNPYKYIDRNGEFPFLLSFALGLWGTLYSNFDNMNCAGDFFGVFGTYALSSALSYCVGSGVNVAMAGGSFSAGFVGNAHGVASTGFYSGFATGAASGFTSAFITGAGTSWINGSSFADGLLNGLKDGAMNSIIEGIIGGIGGGLDALSKHANFFTGRAKIDLNGAYYFSGYWPPEITTMEVIGRYVGDFEGVHVFESPLIGNIKTNWRACTIPEVGIFAVRGALTSMTKELEESGMALLQHEFGHILQYRGWKKAYWPLVAKESFISATSHNSTHYKFWTETWANYLSKEYFGERWLGTYTRFKKWYPAVNISPENLKRVESF